MYWYQSNYDQILTGIIAKFTTYVEVQGIGISPIMIRF